MMIPVINVDALIASIKPPLSLLTPAVVKELRGMIAGSLGSLQAPIDADTARGILFSLLAALHTIDEVRGDRAPSPLLGRPPSARACAVPISAVEVAYTRTTAAATLLAMEQAERGGCDRHGRLDRLAHNLVHASRAAGRPRHHRHAARRARAKPAGALVTPAQRARLTDIVVACDQMVDAVEGMADEVELDNGDAGRLREAIAVYRDARASVDDLLKETTK